MEFVDIWREDLGRGLVVDVDGWCWCVSFRRRRLSFVRCLHLFLPSFRSQRQASCRPSTSSGVGDAPRLLEEELLEAKTRQR